MEFFITDLFFCPFLLDRGGVERRGGGEGEERISQYLARILTLESYISPIIYAADLKIIGG
jgi:hypothetical protein